MRIVIDGIPATGMSLSVVVEHLLDGWATLDVGDEIHLVVGPDSELSVPASITVHEVPFGRQALVSRLRAQSIDVPRLCRKLNADAMLGVLPTTTVTPLSCPRTVIAYDMRYELRPEQFTARNRWKKKISYEIGFRQADAIACISERTRDDLVSLHPRLAHRVVRVAHLGADHVDSWPGRSPGEEYAIAFGQFANKNVDLVVEGWSLLRERGEVLPLVLTGLSDESRAAAEKKCHALGISDVVTLLPWLPKDAFRERFASASLVVFPSDFEGFGLPAVEAMRLGIPVVITPEQTLLEVTGGHASVMDDFGPEALVRAVKVARSLSQPDIAAAKAYVERFTWANTATQMRNILGETLSGHAS